MRSSLQGVSDVPDLAELLAVDISLLRSFAYERSDSDKYALSSFRKKDGSERIIAIPHPSLKEIQRKILSKMEEMYAPSSRAFAYIKGRGLRENAATHLRHRLIFCLDIKDFFDQIHIGRIRGRLRAAPYGLPESVAHAIASLTTYKGVLPFGAPTSPIISNMICTGLDANLRDLGRQTGTFYTRYSDDITFSTMRRRFPNQIVLGGEPKGGLPIYPGSELDDIIRNHGFSINNNKLRLKSKYDSQVICGVVCNEKLNVRRELLREVRGMLNAWRKHGLSAAQDYFCEKYDKSLSKSFEKSLRGKIEFICYVRGVNDPLAWKIVQQFNDLSEQKIRYEEPKDWKATIAESVCRIEAEFIKKDEKEPLCGKQATGFVFGEYIITNRHVITNNYGGYMNRISIIFEKDRNLALDAEVVFSDATYDVALVRVLPESRIFFKGKSLEFEFSEFPVVGKTIVLAGYPNYHVDDTVNIAPGCVTGYSVINGLRVFRISSSVIYGNSGGPVFNDRGKVIGIAVCGSGVNDAPYEIHNGAIPSNHVGIILRKWGVI